MGGLKVKRYDRKSVATLEEWQSRDVSFHVVPKVVMPLCFSGEGEVYLPHPKGRSAL